MRRTFALLGPILLCTAPVACSGPKRPTAPPPEYEAPRVTPWDAAAPPDPFDNLQGEAVTEEPPAPEETPPTDGGSLSADTGAFPAADAAPDGA
ncbi:MAG TPA: hypothetical protein PKA88_16580 [Polyangiaceae bacterium]|nr:hypothetical protein [Polyangiaceae bacterium]